MTFPIGSQDGEGAADHDEPYAYGQQHPTVANPMPFSTRQFAHLLLIKSGAEAERERERVRS